MPEQTGKSELITGLCVAVFLILTAWGNAIGMFVVSVVLLIGMIPFLARPRSRPLVTAAISCGVAVLVALLIQYF